MNYLRPERYDKGCKSNKWYDLGLEYELDHFFAWNKGIHTYLHKKTTSIENLNWWFEKIHPEDSLKYLWKIYGAIADPSSEKWYDEYRFQMCRW
jgi:hypothetical protein